MKILKFRFKNSGPYGNKIQEIKFDYNKGNFYVVLGKNGFGKSTIAHVLSFVFYGKIEGKLISDIPNRINKSAWVEIEFETSNRKKVLLERGINPSILNLKIDGIPYNRTGKGKVQKYLVEELLGIPYYVFSNVISLSVNDFKSFLNMSPRDKRSIIDRIFGFSIINEMREIIRKESSSLKSSIHNLEGRIYSTKQSLESSISEVEKITEKIKNLDKEKVKDLNNNIKEFLKLKKYHDEKFQEFLNEEKELKDNFNKFHSIISNIKNNIKTIKSQLTLYEKDKCPTCYGELNTDFHKNIREDLDSKLKDENKILNAKENEFNRLKSAERDISKTKSELSEKGYRIKSKIENLKYELEKIDSKDKQNDNILSLENIIKNLKNQLNNTKKNKFKAEDKITWLKIIEDVLSERGVKQMAIKTILPTLNAEIFRLLQEMHLEFRVVFDEEFNATITHLGIEISSSSLSTGERKKVDFVVLIAIIELMKIKFPGINILFLDEIFSSVDNDGIYSILEILEEITKSLRLNIFVISHNPLPYEIFDYKIEIDKKNNFSNIKIESAD